MWCILQRLLEGNKLLEGLLEGDHRLAVFSWKMFVFIGKNSVYFLLLNRLDAVSLLPNFRAAKNEYSFQNLYEFTSASSAACILRFDAYI